MSSKSSWSLAAVPDLSGRLAVVTGANSGIGYETAKALASAGSNVILACRNLQKANAARDAIATSGARGEVTVARLDLADLASVERFAEDVRSAHDRLELLVNNAGIMMPAERSCTDDGFELQIGVNHLGHFKLTAMLYPLLAAADEARVVSVASQAHRMGRIDFDDLNWESRRYRRMASYGQSKLANLLFAFELARKSSASGSHVRSLAAHPGWTSTELQRHTPGARFFNKFFAMKRADGALPTLRAALDPEAKSGDYYGPSGLGELRGKPMRVGASERARSLETARRLWIESEMLTGSTFSVSRRNSGSASA